MSVGLFSLARMTVSSSGTGNVTLNAALSGFLTFDLAGCSTSSSGQKLTYAISDGSQSEIARGIYYSSGPTLVRGSSAGGMKSTNSDSPINMSNAAQVLITPSALDLNNIFGNCYLNQPSNIHLSLQQYQGNRLTIDSVNREIPSGGVTLFTSNATLTSSTMYYVYAYMNGSAMALYPSTSAYATDTDTGLLVLSSNVAYTLVGLTMTATDASGSSTWRANGVTTVSWFNPRLRPVATNGNPGVSTTSSSGVEMAAQLRAPFATFTSRPVQFSYTAHSVINTGLAAQDFFMTLMTQAGTAVMPYVRVRLASNIDNRVSITDTVVLSSFTEGAYYVTPVGYVSGGTAVIDNLDVNVSVWG